MSAIDEAGAVLAEVTCDSCGRVFANCWSDEEARAEAEALLPADQLAGDTGTVCGDCFKRIMGRVQLEAPELLNPGAPLVPKPEELPGGGTVWVKRPAAG